MYIPPRTKLELQLNYRKINLNNHLKTSLREALDLKEETTSSLVGSVEVQESCLGSHRWLLKFQRDISAGEPRAPDPEKVPT